MTALQISLASCRLVYELAVIFLFGANLFVCAVAPKRLGADLAWRFRHPTMLAIGLATIATSLTLPLQAAAIGGGWRDLADGPTLSAILIDTAIGYAWLIRALLALLLVAISVALPKPTMGILIVSALMLASMALSGHAAMDDGLRGILHRANDVLHVLSGAAWIGALVPLLPSLAALGDPGLRADAVAALRRFSLAGHGAVALVLATGIVNTGLILKTWPVHWSSLYQLLLATKIVLVGGMVGLALINRYVLVPRIRRCGESAIQAIARRTIVELVLAATVLALVASFSLLDPAP